MLKLLLSAVLGWSGLSGISQTVFAEEQQRAPEQTYKNTLKWSTASEVYNFGYDIYRAEHKDGPFQRITAQPIEGAGTTDVPHYYEYADDTIDPRQRYYYYIESISLSGERKKFTPTREAAPKLPAKN